MSEVETAFINLIPISKPCFDFTIDGQEREKVTVFLVPIAITKIKPEVHQIGWACSRGAFCADCECRYSKKNPKKFNEDPIENLSSALDR